jgi:hypothetical protein
MDNPEKLATQDEEKHGLCKIMEQHQDLHVRPWFVQNHGITSRSSC